MEHSSYSGARNFHDFNTMTRVIFDGKAPDAALHIRAISQTPDGKIQVVAGRNGCIPAKIEVLLDGKPAASVASTLTEPVYRSMPHFVMKLIMPFSTLITSKAVAQVGVPL